MWPIRRTPELSLKFRTPPPTSTASLPRILPSSATVASTSTPAETPQKSWPAGYYVYEHAAAWIEHKRLQDEYGRNNVSPPASWPQLFPGSKFAHTTVTHWRKFWKNAPVHLKTRCIDAGRKQTGSWPYFVDAVRAHQEGRDQVFQDPIVKTEPNSTSIASQSAPDTPGLPQLNFDALIPLSPNLTFAPQPVIPEPPRNDCESCIFCDVEITIRPSPRLDQLLAEILPLTQPSPTPQNANHRTADSSRVYETAIRVQACHRNRKVLTARARPSSSAPINLHGQFRKTSSCNPTHRDLDPGSELVRIILCTIIVSNVALSKSIMRGPERSDKTMLRGSRSWWRTPA
ncbi:hypothetical protein K438DRAFT_1764312 [Mycena galopus ATCC 62051]|nr:hypothetical protein K438DRAFT_1764312 [Mycena galopus ATCC 62051]